MIWKKLFIIVHILLFLSVPSILNAQNIESMLNRCMEMLNSRNYKLYDEAEKYLNEVNKDSIERNLHLEILYHADMAFLHGIKYHDWLMSVKEMDYVLTRVTPVKYLPEYNDSYKNILVYYGYSLYFSDQTEKSIVYFNKLLVEDFAEEFDSRIYDAYCILAEAYEKIGNYALSKSCHNQCQHFLVNNYVHLHPEHSFYRDNYNSIKYSISQLEAKNDTTSEEYVNNLCSLGYLLHKVDLGQYTESMTVLHKAIKCAFDNKLFKCVGLDECYMSIKDIYIKYLPDPIKSEMIEKLIPHMVDFYSGTMEVEDIYESVALTYGADQQYEKSIEYELKILNILEKKSTYNKEKIKKIYKGLVMDYLGLSTDSANLKAFSYLQKIRKIVTPNDDEYYDWYIENYGAVLRYLYKNDEAIKFFNSNLSYFEKKYGKNSDQYISTLNQLALCYPYESDSYISHMQQAKQLLNNSKNVSKTTLRAICINTAQHYIKKGMIDEAKQELKIAESIELEMLGYIMPFTQELINTCLKK